MIKEFKLFIGKTLSLNEIFEKLEKFGIEKNTITLSENELHFEKENRTYIIECDLLIELNEIKETQEIQIRDVYSIPNKCMKMYNIN